MFFKRKRWVTICILSQWTAGFIISIPFLCRPKPHCDFWIWMHIYTFIMIVVIPSIISLITNIILFKYARSSSRRIHPETLSAQISVHHPQIFLIRHRDVLLLRQMISMFCIFIGSWGPLYLTLVLQRLINISPLVIPILMFIAESAVLIDIIKLFVANQEMRQYFRQKMFRCLQEYQ
ncbi:unnamed protein product [Adineta steineri]|uniref:G-protein coupled receptors family 1 profile domain-containing protein n=1 Tax=Adineta steineri TaxID=433720 RepID=A0A819TC01_9BILA|nr:unnamed protein product [Adineta steineri]